MRRPAPQNKPRTAKLKTYPAPVDGWIKNVNLATPAGIKPDGTRVVGASVLENYIPTATGVRMRGGSQKYATIGAGTAVKSAFAYINGANKKLFAANPTAIYDITTVADPAVSPSAAVGSLTSGDWSVVQFATAGGTFLRAVNGADTPLVYDGTSWATTPAITGATPTSLSSVWVFSNRLFFVQSGSLNAWYLPVNSIGGLAVVFPLGGVFTLGGSLLFGSAWSTSTGQGLTHQCVFVSTEGEVAVYQGTDPSSATTFAKVGVYKIGRPLGAKASIQAGGDIAIATDIGLIPLSQAIQRDVAALAPSAVSYPIETAWNEAVADRSNSPWACLVWPTKQMALIALPTQADGSTMMFVSNVRTGAWASITGWDGTCLALFNNRLFFGTPAGTIVEAEVTGADQGIPYTATSVPLFDTLKAPASIKTSLLARTVYQSPVEVTVGLSLQREYQIALPPAPDDTVAPAADVWGTGIWGTSKWGAPTNRVTFEKWQSIAGEGYALSVASQITSGGISAPDLEIVQTDLTFDMGDVVT